mmetsp:Transcript_21789/g.33857  ORF Transcript_21789/g.33857 Transcript_21789/m.33857 type:complete len:249 (-) Transcript_21789:10-756(-)
MPTLPAVDAFRHGLSALDASLFLQPPALMSIAVIAIGAWISLRRDPFVFQWAINILITVLSSAAIRYAQHAGANGAKIVAYYHDMLRIEAEREIVQGLIAVCTLFVLAAEKPWVFHAIGTAVVGTGIVLSGIVFLMESVAPEQLLLDSLRALSDSPGVRGLAIIGSILVMASAWRQMTGWGDLTEETRNSCERIPSSEYFAEGNINTLRELRNLRNMCKQDPSLYQNVSHKERFEVFLENPRDVGVRL